MKIIIIDGVIGWETYPRGIRNQLDSAKGEDIEVQISSPGGFVWDGIEIFNLLRNYKGNITTKLMGLAASMASYIALAGKKVIIESNAVFMIHNARGFDFGDQNQMRKTADLLEGISKLLAKEYEKKSGKSEKEIKKLMDSESFFFGEEIVKEGFADEIIQSNSKDDKADKQTALAHAKLNIENCFSSMRESNKINTDFEKVAAFLNINNFDCHNKNNNETVKNSNIDTEISNKKTEKTALLQNNDNENINNPVDIIAQDKKIINGGVKIMTLQEIKAQFPDIYNQIFKSGIKAGIEKENKRVSSFVQAMAVLPEAKEIYIKAIDEKKGINDPSVQAAVISLMKAGKTVKNSTDENLEDVETTEKNLPKTDDGNDGNDGNETVEDLQNLIRTHNNIETKEGK